MLSDFIDPAHALASPNSDPLKVSRWPWVLTHSDPLLIKGSVWRPMPLASIGQTQILYILYMT